MKTQHVDFSYLKGKIAISVKKTENPSSWGDMVEFILSNGDKVRLDHEQSCCESVDLVDLSGDLSDLTFEPILFAEESHSDQWDGPEEMPESFTWTFYRIGTIKGTVVMRWLGKSNGCYSEAVTVKLIRAGSS